VTAAFVFILICLS